MLRGQLILLDGLNHFVHTCCSLLLGIIDKASLRYSVQTPHDRRLNQTHRPVNVVVLDSWDQNFFGLFEQILLDGADVLDIADVLVEARIDGHVLRSHSEPLSMFVFVFDVEHKRDACRVLAHHFFQKTHGQVHTLHDKTLVPLVE